MIEDDPMISQTFWMFFFGLAKIYGSGVGKLIVHSEFVYLISIIIMFKNNRYPYVIICLLNSYHYYVQA